MNWFRYGFWFEVRGITVSVAVPFVGGLRVDHRGAALWSPIYVWRHQR